MKINLNKGAILGIVGGTTFFILILIVILYSQSDFDQQLINQVDRGVPNDKLIPQIDAETAKLKTNALRRYESNILNKNAGQNGNLASKSDYESYIEMYQNELKMISDYDEARKKFAKREITKELFLREIKTPKEYLKLING